MYQYSLPVYYLAQMTKPSPVVPSMVQYILGILPISKKRLRIMMMITISSQHIKNVLIQWNTIKMGIIC